MLKRITFVILLVTGVISSAHAEVGLGIIVGSPTGISVKSWFNRTNALHIGAGWSLGTKNSGVHVKADYQIHNYRLFPVNRGKLPAYFGLGVSVDASSNSSIGARVPVGLNYLFAGAPLDIFLEIAPVMHLIPSTSFNGEGALGVHYRF